MSRAAAKNWSPARYELGIAARSKAPIGYLKPSKKTAGAIDAFGDIAVGGLLSTTAFMAFAPRCLLRAYPYPGSPEGALVASLLLEGVYWGLMGKNFGALAGAGTAVLLYGMCKLF